MLSATLDKLSVDLHSTDVTNRNYDVQVTIGYSRVFDSVHASNLPLDVEGCQIHADL